MSRPRISLRTILEVTAVFAVALAFWASAPSPTSNPVEVFRVPLAPADIGVPVEWWQEAKFQSGDENCYAYFNHDQIIVSRYKIMDTLDHCPFTLNWARNPKGGFRIYQAYRTKRNTYLVAYTVIAERNQVEWVEWDAGLWNAVTLNGTKIPQLEVPSAQSYNGKAQPRYGRVK